MGMSLESESGSYQYFDVATWVSLLKAARAFGWKPAGTEAPNNEREWNGSYASNDGQCVTAADASALADALSLALLDPEIDVDDEDQPLSFDSLPRFPLLPGRSAIRALVSFCREGYFWID
jgi:hypothetical protein